MQSRACMDHTTSKIIYSTGSIKNQLNVIELFSHLKYMGTNRVSILVHILVNIDISHI